MSALGVNVAGATAWLAVVDDATAVRAQPDRYELSHRPRPQALLAAVEDLQVLYEREGVTIVAVLEAHGNARPASYQQARPRFTLELLFELAAANTETPFELIAPATIQSRLDLPSRRIPDHVDDVVPLAGTRWNHRGPAALAAVAAVRGGD